MFIGMAWALRSSQIFAGLEPHGSRVLVGRLGAHSLDRTDLTLVRRQILTGIQNGPFYRVWLESGRPPLQNRNQNRNRTGGAPGNARPGRCQKRASRTLPGTLRAGASQKMHGPGVDQGRYIQIISWPET